MKLTCPVCGTTLFQPVGSIGRQYHQCPGPLVIKSASKNSTDPSSVGTGSDTGGSAPADEPGSGPGPNGPQDSPVKHTPTRAATDALADYFEIQHIGGDGE